jgi:hypothetical protein
MIKTSHLYNRGRGKTFIVHPHPQESFFSPRKNLTLHRYFYFYQFAIDKLKWKQIKIDH